MENKKGKICPEPVVGALIINSDGEILLGKSKKWKDNSYTVFGGHVETGETMEEAIKREVLEETGLKVEVLAKIGFLESIFDKDFHEDKHFIFLDFLCRYGGEKDKVKLNEEFEDEYVWVKPGEALSMKIPIGTRRIIEEYLEYQKREGYLDGWKRAQADFENYKKRQAETSKNLIQFGNINLISQILPVLDNFHASTEHIPEEQKDSPWVVGIMHIKKQLEKILEDNNVTEIKIKAGDKFDPEIMEAIKQETVNSEQGTEDKCDKKECVVSKILQKGYKINGRVIRPARVVVE